MITTTPEVPCLHCPTTERFLEFAKRGQPVKITGLMESWPLFRALRAQSNDLNRLQLISGLWGELEIAADIFRQPINNKVNFNIQGSQIELVESQRAVIDMGSFIELLIWQEATQSDSRAYMQSFPVAGLGACISSIPFLEQLSIDVHRSDRLWMGNGSRTALHYDLDHNFINIFNGQKKFFLVEPGNFEIVQHLPLGFTLNDVFHSALDLFEEIPPELRSKVQFADLRPGETLYVPARWWHQVQSEGISLARQSWTELLGSNTPTYMRAIFSFAKLLHEKPHMATELLDLDSGVSPHEVIKEAPCDTPEERQIVMNLIEVVRKLPTEDLFGGVAPQLEQVRDILFFARRHPEMQRRYSIPDAYVELAEASGAEPQVMFEEGAQSLSVLVPFRAPIDDWEGVEVRHFDNGLVYVDPVPDGLCEGHAVRLRGKLYRVAWIVMPPEGEVAISADESNRNRGALLEKWVCG